ncbi:LysR family transcriptional regulator [Xanthomonas maliensis]|uniref:LysR family transcriptional regulator n=1 Tax=Xanthomonas maliensis TaxID=1321368 RepID=UPI00039FF474|nr:LysR family transcriptional regulator [Xanthomonas maliensis]KAB7763678.1 LysR family transcriptional regulator [Xanthomonas maliensis]
MPKNPGPNLRHLEALLVVQQAGSISAAAPQVNLSQPALTQAIARLERQLGMALFERQPGGMVATSAAGLLLPRIERALAQLAQGVRLARRAVRQPVHPGLERRIGLGQWQALVALEHAGSYALAAAQAGVSQPAVHRAVQALADTIAVPLVVLRGRSVQLTPAALALLRRVRLGLSELEAGLDELAALRSQQAGRIRLGAMPVARAVLLPQVLARFARLHPGVAISVVEGPYPQLLSQLRDGGLDLLIGALREPPPVRDIVQEPLFADDPLIVARVGHPLASGPYAFAQLRDYPWVVAAAGAPAHERWEQLFQAHGVAPPPRWIECGSVLITRGLLLEDDWLALMSPDQCVVERRAGLLCAIGSAGGGARRIGLTMRSDWQPTRVQHALLQTFRQLSRERAPRMQDGSRWPFRHGEATSATLRLRTGRAESESC